MKQIVHSLLVAVVLPALVSCSDENKLSADILERNFGLPCGELSLQEATWNYDLNVLVVELRAHPQQEFYEALAAGGWVHHKATPHSYYLKDSMFLEYHGAEKTIVIRTARYLPKRDGEEGPP